ncbi:MAG: hypothetical protein L6Q99_11165 [Planctomycetes bacterium]|nr:hypothetical protein [Planctomycetota bacterium]
MNARSVVLVLGATAVVVLARAFVATGPSPAPTCVLGSHADADSTRCVFAGSAGDFDGDGSLDVIAIQVDDRDAAGRGSVRVFSGRTRAIVFELAVADVRLDSTAVVCGDVDGDGRADIALGSPTGDSVASDGSASRVVLHSGRDGRVLANRVSASSGDRFGAALARLDDGDGDGAPELVVAAPDFDARRPRDGSWTRRGRVEVVSGRTLEPLVTLDGERQDSCLGASIAALGDVDGDGLRDWLASAVEDGETGVVRAHSARTGTLLFVARGASRSFGRTLCAFGDVDGDGWLDFATNEGDDFTSQCVELRSGRDGRRLASIGSPPRETFNWLETFGDVLGAPGDVDGDGCADLFVAASTWKYEDHGQGAAGGRAWIHSGRTLETLLELRDEADFDELGGHFAPLGDVDGDGSGDLLVATRRELRVYAAR